MKNLFISLSIILVAHVPLAAQETDAKKDLEKAKAEMIREADDEQQPNYTKAVNLLKGVVTKEPGNATAWYFYGYALDKLNIPDGEHIPAATYALTEQASTAFEKAVSLSNDIYTGELILLDPHTKILSVWGSLALKYLNEGKRDSALLCLRKSALQGGINRTVLTYFKQVINECSSNAYFFTNGDMYLYYLNYLQLVEKFRVDVNCIDLNLLNTKWYSTWQAARNKLPVSFGPADLAKLEAKKWEEKIVSIDNKNPRFSDSSVTWKLSATYDRKFLLRSDQVLLDVLRQNGFRKDVFFAADVPPYMWLFLNDYLQCRGLTNKLVTKKDSNDLNMLTERLKSLPYLPSSSRVYLNNRDNIQVLNNYRFAYTTVAGIALQKDKAAIAQRLMESVEGKYPETTLPFFAEETKQWFAQLKKKIKSKVSLE